ncbi:hypothetical protein RXS06_29090 [Pseudomonas aeruginosa]|nr:hypothetical protein [Pseudomonas aeruginosa]
MPKILIIEPVLINLEDDRGGLHHEAGETPVVPKDTALALVRANRALYVDKGDDPDKSGRNTAGKEMLAAAKDLAAAKAKAEAAPA